MLEPGVIDLNLDDLTDEELAALVEDAKRELAGRQTRGAIAQSLELAVDRVLAPNLNLMGEDWTVGRVSWDGSSVTVTALSPEEYLDIDLSDPEPEPEPEPAVREWAAGMGVAAGDRIRYEGAVYVVVQAHTTQDGWRPDAVPALYRMEG